jgi:hypothetical protein
MKSLVIVTFLALAAALGGCQTQPAPGVTVGPYGVTAPGVTVGPNGVTAPGVVVGPNGVSVPGVVVGPNGVAVPGMVAGPNGVAIPGMVAGPNGQIAAPGMGAPVAAGAALVPASFGVPECDAYAQRACNCSNAMVRPALCASASTSFQSWSTAVQASPIARDAIVAACGQAAAALTSTCGQ